MSKSPPRRKSPVILTMQVKQTYAPGIMLPKLGVASACTVEWGKMIGDERVRYCSHCNLNVYNFSSMTEREVRKLIHEREGLRICGRLYQRRDGTVITKDCGNSLKQTIRRASRLAVGSLSAAMSVLGATAQTSSPQHSAQVAEAQNGIELQVVDGAGAVIPNASISLGTISGRTNAIGKWQVRGISPGRYSLVVNSPGFSSHLEAITIPDHAVLPLQVKMQAETVTVGIIVSEPHHNPIKSFLHLFRKS